MVDQRDEVMKIVEMELAGSSSTHALRFDDMTSGTPKLQNPVKCGEGESDTIENVIKAQQSLFIQADGS
jgi:hypothetical protein